jgi:hypothetical protein
MLEPLHREPRSDVLQRECRNQAFVERVEFSHVRDRYAQHVVDLNPWRGDSPERGRPPIGDFAGHGDDFIIVRWRHRARGRDDPVVALAVRPDESRADLLRRAGNDGSFLFVAHGRMSSAEVMANDGRSGSMACGKTNAADGAH